MPGRGTVDQIYALMDILRRRRKRKRNSYLLFVEFKKAFGTVWKDRELPLLLPVHQKSGRCLGIE